MTHCAPRHPAKARQRGMTLIEILVAIVVLSVGLLGLAGLQLKGLQVSQGSVYRWQAAMLAEDIADRIRADRANVAAYAVALGGTSSATGGTGLALSDWLSRVQTLPGGAGGITTAANQVTITIQWVDVRAQSGAGQTGTAPGAGQPGTFVMTTGI